MKKFVLAITLLFGFAVKAQFGGFWLDYSSASFDDSLTLWQLRSIDNPNDTTDVNYAGVAITGPLAGYTDPYDIENSINEWSYFNGPITFDSLFAYVVHKNYSGLTDTIIFQLVALDNNGKPTNTVLYSSTIYTVQSLSDSNEVIRIQSTPNFTTTQGQSVGITLKYFGALVDTFKLQAGYYKDDLGNADPGYTYYHNSYIKSIPNYPSIVKNTSITNYDGSPIKAQNWRIAAFISDVIIDEWPWPWDTTSVKEHSILYWAFISPNPAQNILNINFSQVPTENITVQVLNTFGQLVKTHAFDKSSGQKLTVDIGDLSAGIYFVQVQMQNASRAFKVVKE
jgi:hypothetical protein